MDDIFELIPHMELKIVKRLPRKKDFNTIYVKPTFNKWGYMTGYTSYIYISNKWHKLDNYKIGIFCNNGDIYLGTI